MQVRHREGQSLATILLAWSWQSRDLNLGSLAPEPVFFGGKKGRVPWLRVKWVLGRLGTQGPWAATVGESPCNKYVLDQEP